MALIYMTAANQKWFPLKKAFEKGSKFAEMLILRNKFLVKTNTQRQARVKNTRYFRRKNCQNLCPFSDQNGVKTIPFGAAHTHIAHIREYLRGASLAMFTREQGSKTISPKKKGRFGPVVPPVIWTE